MTAFKLVSSRKFNSLTAINNVNARKKIIKWILAKIAEMILHGNDLWRRRTPLNSSVVPSCACKPFWRETGIFKNLSLTRKYNTWLIIDHKFENIYIGHSAISRSVRQTGSLDANIFQTSIRALTKSNHSPSTLKKLYWVKVSSTAYI